MGPGSGPGARHRRPQAHGRRAARGLQPLHVVSLQTGPPLPPGAVASMGSCRPALRQPWAPHPGGAGLPASKMDGLDCPSDNGGPGACSGWPSCLDHGLRRAGFLGGLKVGRAGVRVPPAWFWVTGPAPCDRALTLQAARPAYDGASGPVCLHAPSPHPPAPQDQRPECPCPPAGGRREPGSAAKVSAPAAEVWAGQGRGGCR